jgi:hypothetical protein
MIVKNFRKWNRSIVLALTVALSIPVIGSASGKGYIAANGFINHLFKSSSYTAPSNTYVGLLTTCPAGSPNFTSVGTEMSGSSYTRSGAVAANTGWTYTAATSSAAAQVANAGTISFPQASGTWSVNCFGVYDNSSGGNLLYWGPLNNAPVSVGANSVASFGVGALILSEG